MNHKPLEFEKLDKDSRIFSSSSSPVYLSPSSPVSPSSSLAFMFDKSRQEREWQKQLAKLEKEIESLECVIQIKSRESTELKRKLGMSKMEELKEGVVQGYKTFKESETIQKTNAALKSAGDFTSQKFSELRNSTAVKSVEAKVGNAYGNIRRRLSSKLEENDCNALQESTLTSSSLAAEDADKMFGEKVPL